MSVAREHRGQGLGRALVEHLLDEARRRGYRRVLVETTKEWHDAIRLYERCGFVEHARDDEDVHSCRGLRTEDRAAPGKLDGLTGIGRRRSVLSPGQNSGRPLGEAAR